VSTPRRNQTSRRARPTLGAQAGSASEILDFLAKLSTSPERLTAYLRDAKAAIEKEGLKAKVHETLTSGDAPRIHNAIAENASVTQETLLKSRANAKLVLDILSSDPTVAQWLQDHYYQAFLTWLAGAASGTPQIAEWIHAVSHWYNVTKQAVVPTSPESAEAPQPGARPKSASS
jgi:hypothetical protein